ncbi:MAG TPA: gamma-glutamyltransferase, partial [Paralcaligenes sp.]
AAIALHAKKTGGLMTQADLAAHRTDWVEPIRMAYRDIELVEIGPNGQGIGALMALGILDAFSLAGTEVDSAESVHLQIEATKLAFADMHAYVGDIDAMTTVRTEDLLDRGYLTARARNIDPRRATYHGPGKPHHGGTVYLTAADRNGMMVSFIQSCFKGFGSGVVVPDTGIALQNRGWGFSTRAGHPNQVGPGKRPFHTIIPGFLTRQGQPLMTFGVMGGSIQAQGHVQVTSRIADYGQNPQAANDGPRWRIMDDNRTVKVEWNMPEKTIQGLREKGHDVQVSPRFDLEFGCAQMALKLPAGGYFAASDQRKDGYAVGF